MVFIDPFGRTHFVNFVEACSSLLCLRPRVCMLWIVIRTYYNYVRIVGQMRTPFNCDNIGLTFLQIAILGVTFITILI